MSGCGLRPVEYRVVIEPHTVEKKTKGGLYMPDEVHERDSYAQQRGTLVAKSKYAFAEWSEGAPEIGDTVIFVKYAGPLTDGLDGKKYRILNDKDVLAVVEE